MRPFAAWKFELGEVFGGGSQSPRAAPTLSAVAVSSARTRSTRVPACTSRPAPPEPEKRPSDAGLVWPPDQSPAQEDSAETSLPALAVSGAVHRSAKPRADPQRTVAKKSPFQPPAASPEVVSSRCSVSSSVMLNSPRVPVRTGVQPVAAAKSGKAGVAQVLPASYSSGWVTTRVESGGRA